MLIKVTQDITWTQPIKEKPIIQQLIAVDPEVFSFSENINCTICSLLQFANENSADNSTVYNLYSIVCIRS